MRVKKIIPVLRILDENKSKEFYIDFLGFSVEFEHRHGKNYPLYIGLTKENFHLHLSEHYGDCNTGSNVRVEIEELEAFQGELLKKDYKYCKPGIEKTEFQTMEMQITDPFGNTLNFYEIENRKLADDTIITTTSKLSS